MRVKNIYLDDTGTPDEITVAMTLNEAIAIASHVGSLTPSTEASSGIWDALNRVFCQYWEDGLRDAKFGRAADL